MKNLIIRHRQIAFFAVAGAMSAVIEILTFQIFSLNIPRYFFQEPDFHGVHFPLSNILSTSCGILSNYFFSIWFVFSRGKHSKRREFAYFMGVSALSTVLSLLFFQAFFKFVFKGSIDLGFFAVSPKILSKIAAIVVVSALNYTIKKRLIFNG